VQLPSPSTSNVAPNPLPPGATGVAAVTDAWCGAALRKSGSYLILHGGGHSDYAGNEIYALGLEADAPAWQRVWGPTPNSQITENSLVYADGNPAAIHTYGRLQFDDARDTLMRFGSGEYPVGGVGPGVYGWLWGAANWYPASTFQSHPNSGQTFYEEMGYTQDAAGNVYGVNSWVRYVWHHATEQFTTPPLVTTVNLGWNSMAFDTVRNCCWSTTTAGALGRWDVSSNAQSILTLTGAAAPSIADEYMGIAYDPVVDRLFIYRQTGVLYSVNPATLAVGPVVTSGPLPPDTSAAGTAQGVNNKFQYVPNLGGCVVLPRWSANAYFIKTH
jgi:hypothetical protein